MKTTVKLLAMLATVMALAACNHDEMFSRERNIVYTVNGNISTVSTKTESEWVALLDRFCDYAQEASTVTFRNTNNVAKSTKETVTYSTTSREEMKRWMAQMEDAGMTVTISYDPTNGIWNGRAYNRTANEEDTTGSSELVSYTGTLSFTTTPEFYHPVVPIDPMFFPNALPNNPGQSYALQVGDSILVINFNSHMMYWCPGLELNYPRPTMIENTEVTLHGTVYHETDIQGNDHLILKMPKMEMPLLAGNYRFGQLFTYNMNSSIYGNIPNDSTYFTFLPDGTAIKTCGNSIEYSTWLYTEDGLFYCDLLPNNEGWHIGDIQPHYLELWHATYSTNGQCLGNCDLLFVITNNTPAY